MNKGTSTVPSDGLLLKEHTNMFTFGMYIKAFHDKFPNVNLFIYKRKKREAQKSIKKC